MHTLSRTSSFLSLVLVSGLAGCGTETEPTTTTVEAALTSQGFFIPAAQPATTYTSLFVAAVGTPNAIVRIAASARVDLSGLEDLVVAPGVQILGEGSGTELEPALFVSTFPSALLLPSDGVRISGIRIQGAASDDPFAAVDQSDSNAIQIESAQNVEIDHCQIDHWRGTGVAVLDYQQQLDLAHAGMVWVHDNFIHHNQHPTADAVVPQGGHGAGYGVAVFHGAYALIERNVFDDNRHAIAGDGDPGTGYLAYRNLILPHGGINSREVGVVLHTHALDMHGSSTCGVLGGDHNCGIAGEYMDLQYNTVLYTEAASVKLRGTPMLAMNVANNVFAHSSSGAIVQNETGLLQATNAFGLDPTGENRLCDFDGDGILDPFMATGVTWWYAASSQNGRWIYLANSVTRAGQVTLGDVDHDGRCDVTGDGGVLYSGPAGPYRRVAQGSSHGSRIAVARNQDGRLALFGASGSAVYRRAQITAGDAAWTAWDPLDGSLAAVASETNADGRVELFGVNATGTLWHRWQLAAGSETWSPWAQLDGLLVSVAAARNQDGTLALFGTNSAGNLWYRRQLAAGGSTWSAWQAMDGLLATVAAETNADGRVELVGVNSAGQVFDRRQTAAGASSWSSWTQLDGLLTQVSVGRNGQGRLELFGTNAAGMAFHRQQVTAGASSWSAWSQFDDGYVVSGSMATEVSTDGRLEVFGLDRLGQIVHRWQTTEEEWSAWAHLDGSLTAAVPDVRGMTAAAAVAKLTAAGYAAQVLPYTDASCTLAPGFVLLQNPPAGPAVRMSGAPIPPIRISVTEKPNLSECNGLMSSMLGQELPRR
jgi:Tectonin domain/Right handed beta helix region/PASTA domain